MTRWLLSLFAWRTIYQNNYWILRGNDISGERHWVRKPGGGHVPLPMIDDEGNVIPRSPNPPARPTR